MLPFAGLRFSLDMNEIVIRLAIETDLPREGYFAVEEDRIAYQRLLPIIAVAGRRHP